MIRRLLSREFGIILKIINEAAKSYRGVIPDDMWRDPYMPEDKLKEEIKSGVRFYGWEEKGEIVGVMGIQEVKDVTLVRHAYVLPSFQRKGIGGKLLRYIMKLATFPDILVGTWRDATWAVKFYQKHGFKLLPLEEKDNLLRKYWNISERQIKASVVLKFNKK